MSKTQNDIIIYGLLCKKKSCLFSQQNVITYFINNEILINFITFVFFLKSK